MNKKNLAIGYALLCILYFAVSIFIPHVKLEPRGLEGVGKPSLKQKTEEITNDTELKFDYPVGEQELNQISFYFTDNGHVFSQGKIQIDAYDKSSKELLGSQTFELIDLEVEAFWGVTFEEEIQGRDLEIVIAGHDLKEGPSIWLNTERKTEGVSSENGQALENNLIYNAVYQVQVREFKKPLLMTTMLLILGGMFFLVSGKVTEAAEKESTIKKVWDKKWKERWTAFYQRYRQILGLGFLLFLVALIFFYVYDGPVRKAMNSTHRVVVMKDNNELLPVTSYTQNMVQYYTTEEDELVGLGIRMDLADGIAPSGKIYAQVEDATTGEELCGAEIDASTLLDGQYMGLIFSHSQSGVKGHTYRVSLNFSPELWDSGLSVIVTPKGYYQENPLYTDGKEIENRLSMNAHTYFNLFLKKYFFALFVFFELMTAGFYYLAFIRKCKIEKVFLFTILCLGVIYNFILTPYMTPDEKYHIDMSYRHSNTLLGIEQVGENKCLKRVDDDEITFTSEPSLTNYKNIYDGLFSTVQDGRLVEADATSNTEAPMIVYLPAVLGMTLARILHLGTIPMLLLARWCSLLFFALMVYFGMKKLPFGKMTLFLLALLPMNLQQCTSFSYDAVISGTILLYSCYCIAYAYSEEPVKPRDILIMGILSIVFIYGKSGVYLPMCLLALLIPAKRFTSKKVRRLCILGLWLLPVLSFLNKNTATVNYIATVTEATSTVGSSTTSGYTIGYFLSQPLELVRILANTLSDKTAFYLESLIGQKMGWVEIKMSQIIPMLFWLLLILSVLKAREEPLYVKTWQKWWVAFVCLVCTGMILAGMLLTWTPKDYISIEGVQGRYFIPFMLAFSLIGRNKRLMYEKPIDRGLMYAGFVGQLLAVMYLIKAVLVL
ncbi:MAG: DUF2142 domain-containing protein [Lachnospiraceae bacterium]|nr:DUF2142 domain-containing protein [Lachnospiraceae bacterium]